MLGLGLSVTQLAARGLRLTDLAAAIRALFAAGEQGVWYDPSDLTTLFWDAAGTIPVTAVEQPVGLMLDKSKGAEAFGNVGPELLTNGDFSSSAGWSVYGTGISISSGKLIFSSATKDSGYNQAKTITAGALYQVVIAIDSLTSGQVAVFFGDSSFPAQTFTSAGIYTTRLRSKTNNTKFYITANSSVTTTTAVIDSVSLKAVTENGNHAFQFTSTDRPVLSGRYNRYVGTETLATQSVTTLAANYTLSFSGTGSITLSGTATGTYSAGTHTITCTAGTLTSTVSGTVTKADLRVANDGVGLPAYQRVNTSTDYDTTGFPLYLSFNGSNQWMQTNAINFTATDKMSVFAGVRKLSDAALGSVASTFSSGAAGVFELLAPRVAPGEKYGFLSAGTLSAVAITSNAAFSAPATNVLTGIGNISGDQAILRANGVQVGSSTDNQGTGNYGNYSLHLGIRAGSAFPFAGRLYQLVARGAQSTAQQIIDAETYINSKTKAYA